MNRVTVRKADGSSWSEEVRLDSIEQVGKPLPLDSLTPLTARAFSPVGYCIYCGAAGGRLSREHIVPHGLGGTFVLPASSCGACAAVTSAFERKVLRGPMWSVRAHLQLKSRRAALAPKLGLLNVVRGGREELVELPLAAHPLPLMFPRFVEPSTFTGKHQQGITMRGHATYCFGKCPHDVLRDLGADDFRISQDYEMVPFAQLLGKIAWAMAAAENWLTKIDRAAGSLVDALITAPDDIGRWVGTCLEAPAPMPGVLHAIVPMMISDHLVYHIQLFADARTPRYGVVVGRLASSTVQVPTRST